MTDCTKRVYSTHVAAKVALRSVQQRLGGSGGRSPKGYHFCATCRGWHLTSKATCQIPPWRKGKGKRRP